MTEKERHQLRPAVLHTLEQMTDSNQHLEARLWIAENLLWGPGRTWHPLSRAFKALAELRDYYGQIPADLRTVNHDLDERLKGALQEQFSEEGFNLIWERL
jgi:hypothetical protein